jgi:hypothetical protein
MHITARLAPRKPTPLPKPPKLEGLHHLPAQQGKSKEKKKKNCTKLLVARSLPPEGNKAATTDAIGAATMGGLPALLQVSYLAPMASATSGPVTSLPRAHLSLIPSRLRILA